MDDLLTLLERALSLRQRITVALEEFGDLPPEVRLLHDEVEQIEACLTALHEELTDRIPRRQAPTS